MVANKNITTPQGLRSALQRTYTNRVGDDTFSVPGNLSNIVDQPRLGANVRDVVTWRTPHLGLIKMYINPQSMRISDKKDILARRTKAGFVMQYAGEQLTQISINGTTGSGGIEAINILESIYRSEQEAFETIAQEIDRKYTAAQMAGMFNSNTGQDGLNSLLDASSQFLFASADQAVLNIIEQPFPTLASLAANVELIYQGVIYRGYFTSFTVTESVANGLGIFNYDISFTAYAKQGVRRNFMPWHRQPYNPAEIEANPLSFVDPIGEESQRIFNPAQNTPEVSKRPNVAQTLVGPQRAQRDLNNGLDVRGKSLLDLNLEDTE